MGDGDGLAWEDIPSWEGDAIQDVAESSLVTGEAVEMRGESDE